MNIETLSIGDVVNFWTRMKSTTTVSLCLFCNGQGSVTYIGGGDGGAKIEHQFKCPKCSGERTLRKTTPGIVLPTSSIITKVSVEVAATNAAITFGRENIRKLPDGTFYSVTYSVHDSRYGANESFFSRTVEGLENISPDKILPTVE